MVHCVGISGFRWFSWFVVCGARGPFGVDMSLAPEMIILFRSAHNVGYHQSSGVSHFRVRRKSRLRSADGVRTFARNQHRTAPHRDGNHIFSHLSRRQRSSVLAHEYPYPPSSSTLSRQSPTATLHPIFLPLLHPIPSHPIHRNPQSTFLHRNRDSSPSVAPDAPSFLEPPIPSPVPSSPTPSFGTYLHHSSLLPISLRTPS